MSCLYSANIPFKKIQAYYEIGNFEQLKVYLFKLKDYYIRNEATVDLEYRLLYLNIMEAKAFFCMGEFDSVAVKIDEIETMTRRKTRRGSGSAYQQLLYHDLHLDNINECEHGQKCICNKYSFSGLESMDAWYNIDNYFANIWVVVKKKRDLKDENYYHIPRNTVVKYNGQTDVMYLLRGPNQSRSSIPSAPEGDQEEIHEFDRKMAQYNRIRILNKTFINKATSKIIEGDRLAFN